MEALRKSASQLCRIFDECARFPSRVRKSKPVVPARKSAQGRLASPFGGERWPAQIAPPPPPGTGRKRPSRVAKREGECSRTQAKCTEYWVSDLPPFLSSFAVKTSGCRVQTMSPETSSDLELLP